MLVVYSIRVDVLFSRQVLNIGNEFFNEKFYGEVVKMTFLMKLTL